METGESHGKLQECEYRQPQRPSGLCSRRRTGGCARRCIRWKVYCAPQVGFAPYVNNKWPPPSAVAHDEKAAT